MPSPKAFPIYDRTQERLGSSDAMIIGARHHLIGATVALRDRGIVPAGVDESVAWLRSGGVVSPADADWTEATRRLQEA